MQISDLFIRRPVFSIVVSLLLIVGGIAALLRLPVREYPAVDPPVVSISTTYKGASNEVIESRVTEVIEGAISGLEGIKQITASSIDERSSVNIEFTIDRDIEAASSDVRDAVGRAARRLPDGADTPVIRKADSDQRAIIWVGITSTFYDALELSDFVKRVYVDRLSTVPGVANVSIMGERRYAIRIGINRGELAARGLTVQDIETAIKKQNVELPGGRIESSQREFTVKTDSRLNTPEEFRKIIISNKDGYLVRLEEVATVTVGAEDERYEYYQDGIPAVGLGIVKQSTANTLDVANQVKEELVKLEGSLPPDTEVKISYDESDFIRQSINGVLRTFLEGVCLVVLVILIFLRDWRSTLVAIVAIPVSIIAAMMVVNAMGASINVLTLLAIVLAIGIVVDDAIVEIENIHRRIENHEPPLLAAFDGAREIGFAVIATTATLMAVFLPLAFMTDTVGRLFREFAVMLAAAIFFSGVVARTLTPMMCSQLMKASHGPIHRLTEPYFEAMNSGYRRLLSWAMQFPILVLGVGLLVSLIAAQLFVAVLKEFAPNEDRGAILIRVTAPEGATAEYTRARMEEVVAAVQPFIDQGLVASTLTQVSTGFARPSPVNIGMTIVRLVPWEQRSVSQQEIVEQIQKKIGDLPGARLFVTGPPSLGQRGIGQPIQFVLGGPDYETLSQWRDIVIREAEKTGKFLTLDSNYKENQPNIRIKIDRSRAADIGVSVSDIGRTLELMFGETEISTFVNRGDEYSVIMRARAEDRETPSDLNNTFVRASNGQLVPLSSFVTITETASPQSLNRVDRMRAITIQGSMQKGVSLEEALSTLEQIVQSELPAEARISYSGLSRQYKESSNAIYVTFAMSLLVVFLVLAAQFESWINPFIVMLTVPLAITGGLAALLLSGGSLNIYSNIGLILLIGIMAKNGILIVEFASQLRQQGQAVRTAVVEASVMRLRPILMTSIAMAGAAIPLAFSHGAGAEARIAIGTVIIGGIILSTTFTVFVVPAMYLLIGGRTRPPDYMSKILDKLRHDHGKQNDI